MVWLYVFFLIKLIYQSSLCLYIIKIWISMWVWSSSSFSFLFIGHKHFISKFIWFLFCCVGAGSYATLYEWIYLFCLVSLVFYAKNLKSICTVSLQKYVIFFSCYLNVDVRLFVSQTYVFFRIGADIVASPCAAKCEIFSWSEYNSQTFVCKICISILSRWIKCWLVI